MGLFSFDDVLSSDTSISQLTSHSSFLVTRVFNNSTSNSKKRLLLLDYATKTLNLVHPKYGTVETTETISNLFSISRAPNNARMLCITFNTASSFILSFLSPN